MRLEPKLKTEAQGPRVKIKSLQLINQNHLLKPETSSDNFA